MSGVDGYIDFAKRHSREVAPTFRAQEVIWRLESIKLEIELFLQEESFSKLNFHRTQIIHYYIVAIATCFEWHARSRFSDYIKFFPDLLEQKDLEKSFRPELIIKMNKEKLPIHFLIAATKNISSKDEYLSIFSRLSKALDVKFDMNHIFGNEKCAVDFYPFDGDLIEKIFEYRHRIVHEINYDQVGPYSIRETISPEEILKIVQSSLFIIESIEDFIRRGAPQDFPNLLKEDNINVNELDLLQSEVVALERHLLAIEDVGEPRLYYNSDEYKNDEFEWKDVLKLSVLGFKADIAYVKFTESLNVHRAFDFRYPILKRLLEDRIKFLKSLLETAC